MSAGSWSPDWLAMMTPTDRRKIEDGRAAWEVKRNELLERRDWHGYLLTFDSHEAAAALDRIRPTMTMAELVKSAREVWEMDDMPSRAWSFWRRVLSICREHPSLFMTPSERATLCALPNPVVVYRGACGLEARPRGFAWTLDRERAAFFAGPSRRGTRTPGVSGQVFGARADPKKAIAYLSGRNESEILFFPQAMRGTLF